MHEYELLEKRWKRYKRKKVFKVLLVLLFITIIFVSLLNFFNIPIDILKEVTYQKQNIQKQEKSSEQENSPVKKTEEKNLSKNRDKTAKSVHKTAKKSVPKTEEKEPEFIFLPNRDFEKKLPNSNEKTIDSKQQPVTQKKEISTKSGQIQNKKGSKLIIEKKEIKLSSLINNFEQNPTYAKALLIAQKLYKQKRFQEALQWSLKANELNKRSEESWILFAKSLYQLGQKEKAIQTLQFYLQKHPSSLKAKTLLDLMQKGLLHE